MHISKNDRLLSWPTLKARVPYTRQHLLRLEKDGRFPPRIKVGPGRVAWLESEVNAWIDDLAASRKAA
ncbi:MAG: AlpA family phage regulatory protein [Geminicoccaceae bacterium]